MNWYTTTHLVKASDLNHHETLFAGQMASWFIETSFIAAASFYGSPKNIVCLKLHGLQFNSPVNKGDLLTISAIPVYVGKTSILVYGKTSTFASQAKVISEGFITFVCVDEHGHKMPHDLVIENNEEIKEILKRMKFEAWHG